MARLNRRLQRVKEDIIDPHYHLWRGKTDDDYGLADLWLDTAPGHNIIGTVFVE